MGQTPVPANPDTAICRARNRSDQPVSVVSMSAGPHPGPRARIMASGAGAAGSGVPPHRHSTARNAVVEWHSLSPGENYQWNCFPAPI